MAMLLYKWALINSKLQWVTYGITDANQMSSWWLKLLTFLINLGCTGLNLHRSFELHMTSCAGPEVATQSGSRTTSVRTGIWKNPRQPDLTGIHSQGKSNKLQSQSKGIFGRLSMLTPQLQCLLQAMLSLEFSWIFHGYFTNGATKRLYLLCAWHDCVPEWGIKLWFVVKMQQINS